jgi:hypothetical protein
MSKDWFQKSIDTLSLNGKGERTQQAYTRALRMLVDCYGKRPEEITEAELEAYFLRRKNEDRWSWQRRQGPFRAAAPHHTRCAAHVLPRCCGNRHCPGCQQHKGYAWLARQLERQLPTHYFMLTFTVPEALRAFLRAHQRAGYGALFEASAGAIKKLAPDPQYIGADTPGFFGVLHTLGALPAVSPTYPLCCAGRRVR